MPSPNPIYRAENVQIAYQLNFSLSCFSKASLTDSSEWLDQLRVSCEDDGVRILEYRGASATVHQFLLSTQPQISPPHCIRSIKGRWQHLIRTTNANAFKRNYRMETVGEANQVTLERYLAKQHLRHPMADRRMQARLERFQFHDPNVDLTSIRASSHGQLLYNLHFVFENRDRLVDVREDALQSIHDAVVAGMKKRNCQVSQIGIAPNHVHLLAACAWEQSPLAIGLSLMNNLAFVQGMKPVLEFSFYVGSFGNYDRDAIRRIIAREAR